ncbi:hypothetical protein HMPREF1129_0755 [Actinomyces naeslundii str. Howell 279]|uniref:Uncharacterized protein n=1 Tax=Actinomyces naeslundii (strain ATCC 12104 / DSM 43013 / CCUG 2238 / JCM 8349 / NCTC 10301 / Howell 279) TaxID=1115803 RepID=J2ZUA1_ACTNH|nr:hypothetical protein HMPREF1129_0755 [Actinomyces naeslundii str. Howell 279]
MTKPPDHAKGLSSSSGPNVLWMITFSSDQMLPGIRISVIF